MLDSEEIIVEVASASFFLIWVPLLMMSMA